ncbi:AAA family ATPase [Nonomuraea sp. NPDC048826]|uniref:AAA family ATPase n=1 Tax=Nonomuraea sp. NPDC048826 TaxID=3364347 RepID=UPI003712F54B
MFVGREAELAVLRAELRLAAAGPARRVVIEGPEGIGKTALIRQALADAPGVGIMGVNGDAGERHLRYGMISRLLPGLVADDPWTAGRAVCEAIDRAQAAGPVVVLVDDAQWADRPSLRALCYAVRRLDGERVLVLTACRDVDDPWLPTGLRRLLTDDVAGRISLQGLSVAELARLPVRAPEGVTGPGGRPRGSSGHPSEAAGTRRRLPGGEGSAEPPPRGVTGRAEPGERTLRALDPARTDLPPGEALPERTGTSQAGMSPGAGQAGALPAGSLPPKAMPARAIPTGPMSPEMSPEMSPGMSPGAMPEDGLSERAAARLRAHTLGNPLHARAMLAALPASTLADPGARLPAPVTYARTFTRRLRSCGPPARALIAACAVLGEGCTLYEAAMVARAMTGTAARAGADHHREPDRKKPARQRAGRQKTGRHEPDRQESGGQKTCHPDAGHPDAGHPDAGHHEPGHHEPGPYGARSRGSGRRGFGHHGDLDGFGGVGRDGGAAPELDALEEAVAAGVLAEGPGRVIRFRDPLGRAAAYDALGAGTRARLHLAAARITDDTGTELRHRAAAAAGPDEGLAEELAWYAAKEAQHGLWEEAAAHLELAADLTRAAGRRDELRTAALEHVLVSGDVVRAAQLAALPNSDPRPVRRYVLGRLALAEGRLEDAGRLLEEAWSHRESAFAADVAERLAWLRLLGDDKLEAARWARVALAQPIQSPAARPYDVLALAGETSPRAPAVSLAEAVRLLREDAVGRAREVLGRTAEELARAGLPCHRLLAVALLAVAEYRDGRWDDAVERAERAVAEAAGLGQRWLLPCLRVVCVAPLAAQGEHERALAHVAAARDEARRQRSVLGRTQADLAMAVLGAGAVPPAAGDAFVPDPRPQLIETLVAEGALEEAGAVLDGLADTGDGPRARAQRARLDGLVLAGRNAPAAAEERFIAALEWAGGGRSAMEEARALLDLGRLLRRTGRRRAAAERLQAARAVFADLGARPMVARCAQELEACGLEPAVTARLGLTPQEFCTATLVADGLTNRQIARQLLISVKTVEYHLGKIYTKLGIGSRVALAAKLAAYGESP